MDKIEFASKWLAMKQRRGFQPADCLKLEEYVEELRLFALEFPSRDAEARRLVDRLRRQKIESCANIVTWRQLLEKCAGDDAIVANTLTDEELDEPFDKGWGGANGKPFTAWSEDYVYFPATYDGSEWVARVPRNPCDTPTEHVGGQ